MHFVNRYNSLFLLVQYMITRNRIRQDCFELVYQLIQYALLLLTDYIDMCDNNEDLALEKERDLTSMIP